MKRFHLFAITVALLASFSCTDLKEEESVSFGVDAEELVFSSDADTNPITVHSGKKWDVTHLPQWVSIRSITRNSPSPYYWEVLLSATVNNDYSRDDVIVFSCGTERVEVRVSQEGKRGQHVAVQSVALSSKTLNLQVGATETLTATVTPSNASDKTLTWTSSNTSVATVDGNGLVRAVGVGSTVVTVTTKEGNKSDDCKVMVTGGSESGHPWVDLGLSSGLKWAKYNIGASSPEEYGYYYAWGETSPKNEYLNTNLKYCTHVTEGDYYSKYNTVDNKIRLEMTDDVSHMNWGGNWRMPTENEFLELREECRWEWTQENGVKGYKVIGTNGNSIFLPAAGLKMGNTVSGNQTEGHYWSSSIYKQSVRYAFTADFYPTVLGTSYVNRYVGQVVRAVTDNGNRTSVSAVSLNQSEVTMKVGETTVIVASLTPSNASWPEVIWTSSNRSVATVSPDGEVSAIAAGETIITATTYDGGKTATCKVTVSSDKKVIQFADDNLKRYLVSYYDTDGDAEISYDEAAAVTSIVTLNSVQSVTSFDEFQYFTGVQTVPDEWLKGCQKLKSVVLPPSVSKIGTGAFENCTSLTSINLTGSVQVQASAFKGSSLSGNINVACFVGDAFMGTAVKQIREHSTRLSDFYDFEDCLVSVPATCTIGVKSSIYSELDAMIGQLSGGFIESIESLHETMLETIANLLGHIKQIEAAINEMQSSSDYSQIDQIRASLNTVQDSYYQVDYWLQTQKYAIESQLNNCASFFYVANDIRSSLYELEYLIQENLASVSERIRMCESVLGSISNAPVPQSAPRRIETRAGSSSYSVDDIVSLFRDKVFAFDE